jgi:hypothetical protein
MKDTTPTASSIEATFGCSAANGDLFTLRPDIPANEALGHASMMLTTAMALSAEMSDADLRTCRALGHAVGHFVEVSKLLVDASVGGMAPPA